MASCGWPRWARRGGALGGRTGDGGEELRKGGNESGEGRWDDGGGERRSCARFVCLLWRRRRRRVGSAAERGRFGAYCMLSHSQPSSSCSARRSGISRAKLSTFRVPRQPAPPSVPPRQALSLFRPRSLPFASSPDSMVFPRPFSKSTKKSRE
jgi:hypothetical protein